MNTLGQPKNVSIAERRASRDENVVLIADDDVFMRTLVRETVKTRGTVTEVLDGRAAVGAYQEFAPDILFLDIHMPVKNGIDVLQDILTIDPYAFVIMLSGDDYGKNEEYIVQLGASGFLMKPFSREGVMKFIEQCPTMKR